MSSTSATRPAFPLPQGATDQAASAHAMWILFGSVGCAVALLVSGLILWCVLRYRRRRDDDGSYPFQFRRNVKLEIIYTVVPLLLVGVLFAYTYAAERRIETLSEHPDLRIDVTAFRWSWRFAYPAFQLAVVGTPADPPELVLPLGETVRFQVASSDVDHSFWIPAYLFKRDAIPGITNLFDLTPNRLGTFRGQCGEFCGLHHAEMLFRVRVVSPAAFREWIEKRTVH